MSETSNIKAIQAARMEIASLQEEIKRLRDFIKNEVMHPLAASPRLRKLAAEALEGKE